MKKIEKLTIEQQVAHDQHKQYWFNVGRNTDPCDRPKAEDSVRALYKFHNFEEPTFMWFTSAEEALTELKPSSAALHHGLWGQHEVHWFAFYTFCRDTLGIEFQEKANQELNIRAEIGKQCGWWFPYRKVCVMIERQGGAKYNNQPTPVIHCEDGPAVVRGSEKIYAWNGIEVPEEWIENREDVDPSLALTWPNMEQRRCLAEMLGWDKVLDQLNPLIIEEHPDPEMGTLVEVDLPLEDGETSKERFLKVKCGTGRYFAHCVPSTTQTVQQAQNDIWSMPEGEDYAPEIRT